MKTRMQNLTLALTTLALSSLAVAANKADSFVVKTKLTAVCPVYLGVFTESPASIEVKANDMVEDSDPLLTQGSHSITNNAKVKVTLYQANGKTEVQTFDNIRLRYSAGSITISGDENPQLANMKIGTTKQGTREILGGLPNNQIKIQNLQATVIKGADVYVAMNSYRSVASGKLSAEDAKARVFKTSQCQVK